MGQPHGVGYDGIGDNRPRAQVPRGLLDIVKPESAPRVTSPSVSLQLRWESALPIRVAELKSHNEDAPIEVTDGYTMAIYGVPSGHFQGDPKNLADPLKKEAVLKREGKKDVRPSRVEVIQRDDGLVIVYVFPLSAEVSKKDRRIEFDAQIGRLAIAQSFDVEAMQFQGKLEL